MVSIPRFQCLLCRVMFIGAHHLLIRALGAQGWKGGGAKVSLLLWALKWLFSESSLTLHCNFLSLISYF